MKLTLPGVSILLSLLIIPVAAESRMAMFDKQYAKVQSELANTYAELSGYNGEMAKIPGLFASLHYARSSIVEVSESIGAVDTFEPDEAEIIGNMTVGIVPAATDFLNLASMKVKLIPTEQIPSQSVRSKITEWAKDCIRDDKALFTKILGKCQSVDRNALDSAILDITNAYTAAQKALD
ncbi:hypothetical protein IFM47457_11200 [Aspergillus lentulus]|nr:hypothetical protein IFM47457_11200 [Aspergillus lentulus]